MPIYPGDRVPENIQRQQEEQRRNAARLKTAAVRICDLLQTHRDRMMLNCQSVDLLVDIPNGEYTESGTQQRDRIERLAWKVWSRHYMDSSFANPDSVPEPIVRSELLLVTPQEQFCITSTLTVRDENLYDLKSDKGVSQMTTYLEDCTEKYPGRYRQDLDDVVSQIEAKLL